MNDPWVEQQWRKLCERLNATADGIAARAPSHADQIKHETNDFCEQPPPGRYPDFLTRTREAAKLAVSWQQVVEYPRQDEATVTSTDSGRGPESASPETTENVDETLDESFPASDPPSWTSSAI